MTDSLTVTDLKVEFRLNEAVIPAVDGVSFRIPEGRTVALVGESGSGKSVISQAIMGILPPPATITSGQILFRDPRAPGTVTDIVALDTESPQMRDIRGGRISIIFQEPMTSLSPLHTVGDQVGEALHLHREVSAPEGRELTQQILALVGFPDSERALRTYPFELSGGLRQRAMIAMALVCRPALLIADEPTTALDVTIQAQILKLIKDLQAELGMAVLMITHDLGVVANIADEIVVLYQGKVMESGMLQEVYRNPGHDYFRALLRAVPCFNMAEGERLVPLREIEHHTGHLLAKRDDDVDAGPDADAGPGTLLEVRGLSKRFQLRKSGFFGGGGDNEIVAVDNVSFSVDRGRCFGIVGESGSGKTTVSKLVIRALDPDSGEIIFHNADRAVNLVALSEHGLLPYRRKIQFIFQDPFSSLNPRMTVFDLVSEPLLVHNIGDAVYRAELVQELMALVGLDPRFLNRYPHSFSGGQRQRIGIARALALRPALLICDEPVSALDVSVQAQILNLLKDLQDQLGLTYIFISHNLAVVDYIADEIAVMCAGRIVERAPRQALFASPTHPYTRALLAAVPEPNPDARLDFSALMEGRASNPAAWPHPFTLDRHGGDGDKHAMFDLGGGHYVYARNDAKREEIAG